MDFEFNEQQQMFRETFRGYLADHYDLARHAASLNEQAFSPELWQGLAELGLFGMLVPEEHGGLGLGWVDVALVLEELGQALVYAPVVDTLVAADLLVRHGTSEQKARWLARIAAGELPVAIAFEEAGACPGGSALQVSAAAAGSGWQLRGTKVLVPELASAKLLLVAATVGPANRPGVLLVDPATPGIQRREHVTLDPASRMAELVFTGIDVQSADILGGPSMEAPVVERMFDLLAAADALHMTGIAGRMLDLAVGYASQRVQFGRPIGSFQAIKHRCADMAVVVDAARSAAYYSAWAVGDDAADRSKAVSMAKAYCSDAARTACNDTIQIHGGMGFTWDLGLHHYLRRTKLLEFRHGDAAYHRERVIAATLADLGIAI